MAKRSIDPKKKVESSRDSKKYSDFRKDFKGGRDAKSNADARKASSGHYSGGVAPRVGSDKGMPIAVPKPSRVQSGISLAKKKK